MLNRWLVLHEEVRKSSIAGLARLRWVDDVDEEVPLFDANHIDGLRGIFTSSVDALVKSVLSQDARATRRQNSAISKKWVLNL